jgi:hypothetical protein
VPTFSPALASLAVAAGVTVAAGVGGCNDGGARADAAAVDAADATDITDATDAACPGAITGLAFSTDGRRLAIAHGHAQVTVVQLAGAAPAAVVNRFAVTSAGGDAGAGAGGRAPIALTEDGALLAVGIAGAVQLWTVADGAPARLLDADGPRGDTVSLKFSDAPTPLLLAGFQPAAAPGDNLKIWRIADGVLVGSLAGSPHATFTYADEAVLLVDEARARFAVVSFNGRELRAAAFTVPLALTAFAPDGAYLGGVIAAGTDQEQVAIMSVADDAFVWQAAEQTRATRRLLFLENPSRVVQLGARTLVLDHEGGRLVTTLPRLDDAAVVAPAPDGAAVAAVTPAGAVVLLSTSDPAAPPRTLFSCPP